MQRDIPFFILRLLDRAGNVPVQGLGVFSMHAISAWIDRNERKIYPPRQTGRFREELQESAILPMFMSDKTGIDAETCASHITAFVQNIREETREDSSFEIDAFGKFWRDTTGKLSFTPDSKAFNQRYVYFRPLELIPASELDGGETKHGPDARDATGLPISQQPGDRASTPKEEGISPPTGNDRGPGVHDQTAGGNASEVRKRNMVFLLLLLIILLIILSWMLLLRDPSGAKGDQQDIGSIIGLVEEQPMEGEQETITPEKAGETKPETEENTVSPGSEQYPAGMSSVVTDDWDCLVVAGAFAVDANRDRMIERLTSFGYRVRIAKTDGLTRVGVPVNCDPESHGGVLQDLRQAVEPSAWIFKKEDH